MPGCIEQDYIRVQPRTLISRVQRIDCADDLDLITSCQDGVQAFLHDPNVTHNQNAQRLACFVGHRL